MTSAPDITAATKPHRRRPLPLRGALALGRARLRATGGGRFGVAAALGVTALYGILAIVDGSTASLCSALPSMAGALAWVAAGPIALAAARDRPAADRRDGIEALAAARGIGAASLHGVRTLAAMLEIASAIAVPSGVLAGIAALLAGKAGTALRCLEVGGAIVLFAFVCGVTLGGLAAASGRLAGPRGRTLFAALILIPWALADLAGGPSWSIPGALDAFLSLSITTAEGSR